MTPSPGRVYTWFFGEKNVPATGLFGLRVTPSGVTLLDRGDRVVTVLQGTPCGQAGKSALSGMNRAQAGLSDCRQVSRSRAVSSRERVWNPSSRRAFSELKRAFSCKVRRA